MQLIPPPDGGLIPTDDLTPDKIPSQTDPWAVQWAFLISFRDIGVFGRQESSAVVDAVFNSWRSARHAGRDGRLALRRFPIAQLRYAAWVWGRGLLNSDAAMDDYDSYKPVGFDQDFLGDVYEEIRDRLRSHVGYNPNANRSEIGD